MRSRNTAGYPATPLQHGDDAPRRQETAGRGLSVVARQLADAGN
jgi:hypothetical protein